ncbi:nucleoid-associated protein [Kordia sp. TARA_039_SRF]|nr:nucleoid-associated protein [Kordia sp. TARA_039_SRF]
MFNLYAAEIDSISIHKVGNKARNESVFFSENPVQVSDELMPLLKEYFFKPFRDKQDEYYQFNIDVEKHNPLQAMCKSFFNLASDRVNESLHNITKKIAQLLYDNSQHPHIKSGELYVTLLNNVVIDDNKINAIGIFKSEIKDDFLQIKENGSNLDFLLQQGINLNKLDKGCIIFNTAEAYKIVSVDTNKYDTKYWIEHFLDIDIFQDENFYTKKYLKFCQGFAKDVIFPLKDKKEEVMFMNRTLNHFAKNETFDQRTFLEQEVENPEIRRQFHLYKETNAPKYSIEDLTTFPISNKAVSKVSKQLKSTIQLDTNITIKMDFINPESADRFVEKGWDEERQMYYYLLYFNKEQK